MTESKLLQAALAAVYGRGGSLIADAGGDTVFRQRRYKEIREAVDRVATGVAELCEQMCLQSKEVRLRSDAEIDEARGSRGPSA